MPDVCICKFDSVRDIRGVSLGTSPWYCQRCHKPFLVDSVDTINEVGAEHTERLIEMMVW